MRILVSRPLGQARSTARRLAARGHEAIVAPILEIVPTGLAPPRSVEPAALILTSAHAVPAALGHRDRFGDLPVFVVGARTAEALSASGGYRRVVSAAPDGATLARLAEEAIAPGAALLHLGGRDRAVEPASSLSRAGFNVFTWDVYEARAVEMLPPETETALADRRLDAALHYSRRSAAVLVELARIAGRDTALASLHHLCISADAVEGLRPLAPRRLTVARSPTEDELLALLPGIEAERMPCRSRASTRPGATEGTMERPTGCGELEDDRPR